MIAHADIGVSAFCHCADVLRRFAEILFTINVAIYSEDITAGMGIHAVCFGTYLMNEGILQFVRVAMVVADEI